ncbi:PCF11 [Mytilus edulis]|uniref:PCF11 n=1 Tax=Mytilus edulis TaxID=6550 RepID=A0A8S3V7X1_MYTED|nr:PCF11 [Mytilus edulis]
MYQTWKKEQHASILTSGDIDAVTIHMFALCHLWPRNDDNTYKHPVYIILQKPGSTMDVYNVTAILQLLERRWNDRYIGIKIAIFLCLGGNDFLPKFYNLSHLNVVSTIVATDHIFQNLVRAEENEMDQQTFLNVTFSQESYRELIELLYCPKTLDSTMLSFEEIRQLTVKAPTAKISDPPRNYALWMPAASVLNKLSLNINCLIKYYISAGQHTAFLPNFLQDGCLLKLSSGEIEYNLGSEASVDSESEILIYPPKELASKLKNCQLKERNRLTKKADSRYLITALSFRGRKIKQTKTSAAVHGWNGPISIRDSRIEVKYVYGILQLKRINLVSELYTSAVAALQPEPLNVESLLQRLIKVGLIAQSGEKAKEKEQEKEKEEQDKEKEKEEKKSESESPQKKEEESSDGKEKKKPVRLKLSKPQKIPDLTEMKSNILKKQYIGVIQRMYSGIQCTSCGTRFMASQTTLYREHLDWHFRQNQREKKGAKISRYRSWFYELNDWLEYEDVGDSEERVCLNNWQHRLKRHQTKSQHYLREDILHCPAATGEDSADVCVVCGDVFEQFFDEESEEWHLKNALRSAGKTYHPVCYEDAQENSTPKEDPGANPMMLQIQKELGMIPADTVVSFPAANVISVSQHDHTPKDINPDTPPEPEGDTTTKEETAPS